MGVFFHEGVVLLGTIKM